MYKRQAHQEAEAAAKIIKTMESSMPKEDKKQSELRSAISELYWDKQKMALRVRVEFAYKSDILYWICTYIT